MQLALGHRISADATPPPGSRARLVAQLLPVWKLPAWYMLGLPGICQNEFDILPCNRIPRREHRAGIPLN